MRKGLARIVATALVAAVPTMMAAGPVVADNDDHRYHHGKKAGAQLGPRPFYLVDKLEPGRLKRKLRQCDGPFRQHKFSIGHRGAPLQFPEHTRESYVAAARMGAGIIECDVTFTSDSRLVCRHAQADLHTTTDILLNPDNQDLADKACENGSCSTSKLTLAEFRRLKGKMDTGGATATFRTDLYATGAKLLTHRQSIRLFDRLGADFTPELKADSAGVYPGGQEAYARALIEEYKDAGISPRRVWAQSFNLDDVLYWIENYPRFGKQAVYLDGRYAIPNAIDPSDPDDPGLDPRDGSSPLTLQNIRDLGVRVIAPPMWMLVKEEGGEIVPSKYAIAANEAGLKIISWTTERSGRINEEVIPGGGAFYYDSTVDALTGDGDILRTIDVLARKVGIIGLFSDWPATTTFYANCMLGNDKRKYGGKHDD
ncbi:MAG: glycerophosphodiester phosphodiesterase [Rhodospirillaceae bacterium]|nr:glycerophosphodiester phosphodiesterase [Rhodospirillaceae bacterium]